MENQPIKIETIAQLFEVLTFENEERFLMDFCAFVHGSLKIKQDVPDLEIISMSWLDDGIHELTGINIHGEDGSEITVSLQNKE